MRFSLDSLPFFLILLIIPFVSGGQLFEPQRPTKNSASRQRGAGVLVCNKLLPPWGGKYASWGFMRDPSIEQDPSQTEEIEDFTHLCSLSVQSIFKRLPDNPVLQETVVNDLLYDGKCVDGTPTFAKVTKVFWLRLARVFLNDLDDANLERLWNGHEAIKQRCRLNCFCQDDDKLRREKAREQKRANKKLRESRWHTPSAFSSTIKPSLKSPYRPYYWRPYVPHKHSLGPVLEASVYPVQDSCSALAYLNEYDIENVKGVGNDVQGRSWPFEMRVSPIRRRRQAVQRVMDCIADRQSLAISG